MSGCVRVGCATYLDNNPNSDLHTAPTTFFSWKLRPDVPDDGAPVLSSSV